MYVDNLSARRLLNMKYLRTLIVLDHRDNGVYLYKREKLLRPYIRNTDDCYITDSAVNHWIVHNMTYILGIDNH